ncbi:sigma-70 family RNA polymerase sigma factor [Limnohabitans sp. Bal53]|uniref:sigma-70 family RNA polymerase sigma factor n=1 Tax=Limnohabitans sp. Bal53 TaxID=1977910 RepID=UPI000D3DA14F|nr:sigma-70 family RNA polymerase sigma factor [Limnohabitans sp. Bal53]PUE39048.1 RNA polymerase subunit sigma-70 [Limnohabitans sp. Bal53]
MNNLLLLWARHETEVRRWLLSRAPAAQEVDDILQDVFLKALRQGAGLEQVEHPRAWLFEVARNTLTDRLRVGARQVPLPDDIEQLALPEVAVDSVDALAQACLPRVLDELDAQDREAIELCDLQGMDQATYALSQNISLSAAKSRIQRARKRMRERMTVACQVRFDDAGHVSDFVPRSSSISGAG